MDKSNIKSTDINDHQFKGVYTALITPFNSDGSLDLIAFDRLLDRQIDAGIAGVAISGTTGEAPCLKVNEKLALIKRAKAHCQGKLHLMAGTGSSDTQQTVELSNLALDAGADSLLVVTPAYNKPTVAGLIHHYNQIATANSYQKKIVLYHVPARTSLTLTTADLKAIMDSCASIVAVKEASSNPTIFNRFLLKCHPSDRTISYLSGDDHSFLPTLSVGGSGIVSVLSNIFPKEFNALYQHYTSGNIKLAADIHARLFEFIDALFKQTNPLCVKTILFYMNLVKENFRLPLYPLDKAQKSELIESYHRCKSSLSDLDLNC